MTTTTKTNYKGAFITVTSLFFLWGFITVFVDSLIPHLRDVFELTYFQSNIVQFAFFIAYGLISIPAGWLLPRLGYKKGLVLGLVGMGAGCLLFWLAAEFRVFGVFLSGMFVLAGGMTVLQVAANPYISLLGPEKTASSRLNLAQAFNSLGTTIAPVFGALLILKDKVKSSADIDSLVESERLVYLANEAKSVQEPFLFVALAIFLLAVLFLFIQLPKIVADSGEGSYKEVLTDTRLMFGAVGIFVYVGVEVAIGTNLVGYFIDMNLAELIKSDGFSRKIASLFINDFNSIDAKGIVATFVAFYWGGAMVGRFIGAYLTTKFNPAKVLSVFSVLAMLMVVSSIATTGLLSMWSILSVGLFNSIMFPTIFTLAIGHLGKNKPQGSGILCTAIVGGAFIPPLFGFFADMGGFKLAFLVPIICYLTILFYGKYISKNIVSA